MEPRPIPMPFNNMERKNSRHMSIDLSLDPARVLRPQRSISRRESIIKKEIPQEKQIQLQDIIIPNQNTILINPEMGRKKLKNSKEPKPSIKNSYINGIKKLANTNFTNFVDLTTRGLKHITKSTTENVSIRKLKNRESAKNSRMRRKMYIELLEKKIIEQQEELQLARRYLDNMGSG